MMCIYKVFLGDGTIITIKADAWNINYDHQRVCFYVEDNIIAWFNLNNINGFKEMGAVK